MGQSNYKERAILEAFEDLARFQAAGFNIAITRHKTLGDGKWWVSIDKESNGVTFKIEQEHHHLEAAVTAAKNSLKQIVAATESSS